MRECSDRARPLINAVHNSPTNAVLQALVNVERDLHTELDALMGVIEVVDEVKNDAELMTHMCLSRQAARGSDSDGLGEGGSSRSMGQSSAGVESSVLRTDSAGRSAKDKGRRKVRLQRDEQGGLGIDLGRADADDLGRADAASNEPYYVTSLTEERPGHLCGEVAVGDVLAEIDGHDIAPLLGALYYRI